jgi:hypothetical protein
MNIWIGAVTGDVEYFLLTDERRKELRIPVEACRPVLSRARHLAAAMISSDVWRKLRSVGERVWMFHPSDRCINDAGVYKYIELAKEIGGCNRDAFKVRDRIPWFRVRLPPAPHAFLSGISTHGPWLAMCNMRRLTATNTLYVARFIDRLNLAERAAWAISMATSIAASNWKPFVRAYPGGLKKIEPGSLGRVKIPIPPSRPDSIPHYTKIVELILQGKSNEARLAADRWCRIAR